MISFKPNIIILRKDTILCHYLLNSLIPCLFNSTTSLAKQLTTQSAQTSINLHIYHIHKIAPILIIVISH